MLKVGDTSHFFASGANPRYLGSIMDVEGGQVIAVDQNGRTALVANTLGKSKTLLCAHHF
jgi:hypothetical protein